MSTTTVVVEHNELIGHSGEHLHKEAIVKKHPERIWHFEVIRNRIRIYFIESVTASLIALAGIGLYKFSGAHALWVQFLQKII